MGAYKVTINADAYISSATTDVPVLVKFNSTDHPDLFLTGDTEDSVWFSSDAEGQNTLYHEGVIFDSTDAVFYVRVDLSATADTVIYFWFDDSEASGTENKTNVWKNGVEILHLETLDLTDSMGNYTPSWLSQTETSSGVVGGGVRTGSKNGGFFNTKVKDAFDAGKTWTILYWGQLYDNTTYSWSLMKPYTSQSSPTYQLTTHFARSNNPNELIIKIINSTGTSYLETRPSITASNWNLISVVAKTGSSAFLRTGVNTNFQTTTSTSGTYVNHDTTLHIGGNPNTTGTTYCFNGYIDEVWIFSDVKSDDWIKAVCNNVQNYGSFIDIEIFKSKITTPNILSFNSNVKFKKKKKKKKLLLQDNLLFNSNLHQTKEIPKISWDITIKSGINTYNLKDLNILESAEYSMTYDKKSNNMSLTVLNDGSYWNKFKKGGNVSFYLINDYTQQKTKLFEGIITYVGQNLNNFDFSTIDIRAENYGMFRLKQTLVTGTKEYINRTPTQIIKNLIQTYAPDIKLDKLQEIDINIPYKFFNWIYLNEAIEEVTKLIEGYYYIDVDNYLIVKLFSDQKVSKELTKRKIVRAKIEDDIEDVFDRIFILGGKEHLLDNDFSDDDIVLGNNTKDYSYATKLATDRTNLLSIEIAVSKVGIPRYPLSFDIVADKSGMPSDNVLGSGNFYEWDIQEDVSWIKSNPISISFAQPAVFWVVFNNTTDFENYYVIYHDNETENGHKRSSDGVNWSNATGKIAIKNYYGYQIVSIKKGEKQLNKFYSDFLLADENIETKEMSDKMAEKLLVEKQYKKSSVYTIIPSSKPMISPSTIRTNIDGILSENQIVSEVMYRIDQRQIIELDIYCVKSVDFYTIFGKLYNDLRKLNVGRLRSGISRGIEYITPVDEFEINENAIFVIAENDTEYYLGDEQWIFGVFKWD